MCCADPPEPRATLNREVVPDVDIAAQVGKDFFLDEKIPRHESGQGYVRVVEQSIMWRETETAKVFTYQRLTTCTELDKSWTVMSSIYKHNEILGQKAGANSFPVGESGRRRTRRM